MNIPHDVHLSNELIRLLDSMEQTTITEYQVYCQLLEHMETDIENEIYRHNMRMKKLQFNYDRIKSLYPEQP